jgi:hypothetical protein
MQFNILAEGLSADPKKTPHFSTNAAGEAVDESTFGNFDSVENPEVVFDFDNFRCWRIVEEILRWSPDIIAVQEIDRFADFFEPVLGRAGYKVRYC